MSGNFCKKASEKIDSLNAIIKEQDKLVKKLEEYNIELKNAIFNYEVTCKELTIENDTLREKCEKNNVEIG